MVKESVTTKKKTQSSPQKKQDMNNILIENFVSLQKVMTNLAVKFDSLSGQITKLLDLFELSAKAFAEKNYSIKDSEESQKTVEKLNTLLDQNKIIAKGIALLHEKEMYENPLNNYSPTQERESIPSYAKPLTRAQDYSTPSQNFRDSKIKTL